jgi:cytochrome oxidase Cu insertion factor (SCO1/SenC/PrrC family)
MARTSTRTLWSLGVIVVVVGGLLIGYRSYTNAAVEQKQAATYQQLMALNSVGGQASPDFTLTDQNGQKVTLSSLKGKTVILQFMDPVCTDICPIVSQEILDANKDLGADATNVVYVTVNVNQYHASTADVMQFSKAHALNTLPNWHFVTGSTAQLQKIWHDYGITVQPNPDGDVVHSSFLFFIDKEGKQQYIANPNNNQQKVTEWGHGIAYYANKLV